MIYTELEKIVKSKVSTKRFIHSSFTALLTKDLTARFWPELDDKIALIAGIYHDYAREWLDYQLLRFSSNNKLDVEKEEYENPLLLHGPVASYLLKTEYNTTNNLIEKAIRYHTVGSKRMGTLGAALYVADYLEPTRKHVKHSFRQAVLEKESLEEMVYLIVLQSESYLKSKERDIIELTKELKIFLESGGIFSK